MRFGMFVALAALGMSAPALATTTIVNCGGGACAQFDSGTETLVSVLVEATLSDTALYSAVLTAPGPFQVTSVISGGGSIPLLGVGASYSGTQISTVSQGATQFYVSASASVSQIFAASSQFIGNGIIDVTGSSSLSAQNSSASPEVVGYLRQGQPRSGGSTVRLTYTSVPSVPEPATWAMMLCGFAGIGATMRRRKREPNARTA